MRWSDADRAQLAEAGIDLAEAERQLDQLAAPPPRARLDRPCAVGDGIERLTPARVEELAERGRAARDAGQLLKFVPASGAASRMFRELQRLRRALAAGDEVDLAPWSRLAELLPSLALGDRLAEALGEPVDALPTMSGPDAARRALAALLDPDALGADALPKALLPFHRAPEGPRSAFTEHLAEAIEAVADRNRLARLHVTLAGDARERFAAELARAQVLFADRARFEVAFSEQSTATATLALDEEGRPARDDDGRLRLRPSGHGALLPNLERSGGEIVLLKNIDNVRPERDQAPVVRWLHVLAGLAAEHAEGRDDDRRPLRVAGVVPNTGEPGGGPFWVRDAGGATTRQIVEGSQVDLEDADQRAAWESSTHFNPVGMACVLRDRAGAAYRLDRFVDPDSAIVTRRSEAGHLLTVLERPGLWNGSMADWETRFVEVPGFTFAPVKSVFDLARPEHRG